MVQDKDGLARLGLGPRGEVIDELAGEGGDVRMRNAEEGANGCLDPWILPATQEAEHRGLALRSHFGTERREEWAKVRLRRFLQAGAEEVGLIEKDLGGEQLLQERSEDRVPGKAGEQEKDLLPPLFPGMRTELVEQGDALARDVRGREVLLEPQVEEAVAMLPVVGEYACLAMQPLQDFSGAHLATPRGQAVGEEVRQLGDGEVIPALPAMKLPGDRAQEGEGSLNVQRWLGRLLCAGAVPLAMAPRSEEDAQALIVERGPMPGHLATAVGDDAKEGQEERRAHQDLPALRAVAGTIQGRQQTLGRSQRFLGREPVGQRPLRGAEPVTHQVTALGGI